MTERAGAKWPAAHATVNFIGGGGGGGGGGGVPKQDGWEVYIPQ